MKCYILFVILNSFTIIFVSGNYVPESAEPHIYEDKPAIIPQPDYEAPKEPYNSTHPHYDGPKPEYDEPKPVYDSPRPDYDGPRSDYDGPKPIYDGPRLDYDGPRPDYDGAKPGYDDRRPNYGPTRPSHSDYPREPYNNPQKEEPYKIPQPGYDNNSRPTYGEYAGSKECNCVRWTNWISADTPSNSGDFETIGPPDKKGRVGTVHHVRPDVCTLPLRMECRTLHDATPWYLTYEHITEKCTPHDKGFSCENKKQIHKKCKDYEIRLLCFYSNGYDCPCLYWTDWYDTYDPIGKGDEELIGRQLPKYVCEHGFQPVDVQCETVLGLDVYHAGNKNVKCDLEGLSCYNEDQGRNCKCHDYRVRFLCPKFPSNYPIPEYDFNSNKTYGSGDYGSGQYDGGAQYEKEKYLLGQGSEYQKPLEKRPGYDDEPKPNKEYGERPPYEQPPPVRPPPPYEQPPAVRPPPPYEQPPHVRPSYEQPPPVRPPPPYEKPIVSVPLDISGDYSKAGSGDYNKHDGKYNENDRRYDGPDGGYKEDDRGYKENDRRYDGPEGGYKEEDRGYKENDRRYDGPDGGYKEDDRRYDGGYKEDDRGYDENDRRYDGGYEGQDEVYEGHDRGYDEHDKQYQNLPYFNKPYVKPKKTFVSGIVSKASVQEGHSGSAVNFKTDYVNRPGQYEEGYQQNYNQDSPYEPSN